MHRSSHVCVTSRTRSAPLESLGSTMTAPGMIGDELVTCASRESGSYSLMKKSTPGTGNDGSRGPTIVIPSAPTHHPDRPSTCDAGPATRTKCVPSSSGSATTAGMPSSAAVAMITTGDSTPAGFVKSRFGRDDPHSMAPTTRARARVPKTPDAEGSTVPKKGTSPTRQMTFPVGAITPIGRSWSTSSTHEPDSGTCSVHDVASSGPIVFTSCPPPPPRPTAPMPLAS
jgi:hypothetical protein